jgi:hypothetical protein
MPKETSVARIAIPFDEVSRSYGVTSRRKPEFGTCIDVNMNPSYGSFADGMATVVD